MDVVDRATSEPACCGSSGEGDDDDDDGMMKERVRMKSVSERYSEAYYGLVFYSAVSTEHS